MVLLESSGERYGKLLTAGSAQDSLTQQSYLAQHVSSAEVEKPQVKWCELHIFVYSQSTLSLGIYAGIGTLWNGVMRLGMLGPYNHLHQAQGITFQVIKFSDGS